MPTIRKRGDRWNAQVRIRRSGEIVFQDTATFDTKKQAEAWGRALEARVNADGYLVYVQSSVTIREILLEWEKSYFKTREMTRGYQHSLKALHTAKFVNSALKDLRTSDIVTWAKGLTVAPATVLHHLMVLRSAMGQTKALMNIEPRTQPLLDALDHLKRTRVVAKSTKRERRISDDELTAIEHDLKSCSLMVPTHLYVRLAVALPRRREEICTMLWSDYDGVSLTLRDTKNPDGPRTEVIPVPPQARTIIDQLDRFDARIFPYKPESVSAAFQRCVRRIGLADIRLHDLRHEGISRLFEQGLLIPEVALISGHLSWNTLRRYTHLKPHDVVEKLNARLKATQKTAA